MNLSAKAEYACIAVLELAADHGRGRPVRIRDIAETHGIPSRFLVQILLQLKSAGLVSSTRGAAGGYRLAKDPHEITLGDVMEAIEGPGGRSISNAGASTEISRTLQEVWAELAGAQREMLDAISFADLTRRLRGRTENMYYI